ncbi:MAG: ElyC/SanA/YdcF family protein [Verrucomicrobiota bacterium]
MKLNWRRVGWVLIGLALLGSLFAGYCWQTVGNQGTRLYSNTATVPHNRVALVLGCSSTLRDGSRNLFFHNRMHAAAALYQAGKVEYLLVSGDNRRREYDEPSEMKAALMRLGVPEGRIVCDYAGFTTLDSIIRARVVFGQTNLTIVSQAFHNQRALYIADGYGVIGVAFNAAEVPVGHAFKTYAREVVARMRAWLDVNLIRRQPHFLGEPVVIPTS